MNKTYPLKLFRGISAAFGGLILSTALSLCISQLVSEWSPTATAKECFHFPSIDSHYYFEKDEIKQFLLMRSFFGSDSLYFDRGDENTGNTSMLPDKLSDKIPPQIALEAPDDSSSNTDIYSYDRSKCPAGEFALLPYDLSGKQPGKLLLTNTTSYETALETYAAKEYPISSDVTKEPLVLIVHTHGTESFAPENSISVSSSSARSSDTENNIVAVGKVMANLLNDSGIPTLHCEIMHDIESYRASYDLCADTVREYLAKYPSIKYVFDVHRDAIVKENGDIVKPICSIDGEPTAQIMLLVGTNEKGADHPNWKDNLTIAAHLQSKLIEKYENLARPINIRGASFNQQFTSGSLLIEIGSSGNTLTEAKNAARRLTYSIIELIEENQRSGDKK